MWFFKGFKDTYKKSEAAVVVQNLLQMQFESGLFASDPASTANEIVGVFWDRSSNILDGRFGQRPHKISLAAGALAEQISDDHTNSNNYAICLGNILNEVSVNGALYPFNSLDHKLLEGCAGVLQEYSEEFLASPLGAELDELMSIVEDHNND